VRTFCGQSGGRGLFRSDVGTLLVQKNRIFEIHGLSARTRKKGLSRCGHFSDKRERGSIFYDFVRTSFLKDPLLRTFRYIIGSVVVLEPV